MDNKPKQNLSNEQWKVALELLADMVESGEPAKIINSQTDESLRSALESLWHQYQDAEKLQFLEKTITIVGELSSGGRDVFQPAQLLADRFAILRRLGRGGMGEVYLADDQRLKETVALKTIKRTLARDVQTRARFLAEVQSSRRVTHPNVCRIFDLFEHEGVPFLSMEYVAGPTLAEVLAAGPLDAGRAKAIAIQTAEGLLAAHHNGILHCDFKPNNIILAGSGKNERAVITDFGLARALSHADSGNEGNSMAGTPPFMAPELLRGESPTVRTDIYAYGKVMEALLPGNKLASRCTAPDANDRPESFEVVLKGLRGTTTRRDWIVGLTTMAASAAGLYLYSRPGKIIFGSRQGVQVNGFRPESPDEAQTAQTVRSLLVMALRQSSLLSVLDDRRYRPSGAAQVLEAGFPLPTAALLEIARGQNVRLAVDGSVRSVGKGLRLRIDVYDSLASKPFYSKEMEVDDRQALLKLAELAADDLRENPFKESGQHNSYTPLELVTSKSPGARDFYFRAVAQYQKMKRHEAMDLLDQAVALDPDFALAHHYRSLILSAGSMMESAQEATQKAYDRRYNVTTRERNWIEAEYHKIRGAYDESASAMIRNTNEFPDEAIFQRQAAFALMRLGRYDDAIPFSMRAVQRDPLDESNAKELVENLAEANRLQECFKEKERLESITGKAVYPSALALAYMQQGDYGKSAEQALLLGKLWREEESWSRLLLLPPLIMSGKFSEAIQSIQADLVRDEVRPAAERDQTRTYWRRVYLGQLYRLQDRQSLAMEQAESLVQLRPLGANLLRLREGIGLAFDLNELKLAEHGLERLIAIDERWPSAHSKSAVVLAKAMLKDARHEDGPDLLFEEAKVLWPDPINLFYVARWQGKAGNPREQLANLLELERMRGKVFKFHFPGLVVLGWLEQAKCFEKLSRFDDSLRMYERAVRHWGTEDAAGSPVMRQALNDLVAVKRRMK